MNTFDEFIIRALVELRSPVMNRIAADITALGSVIVVSIQTAMASLLLIYVARDPKSALQAAVAPAGAELWVEIIKRIVRRGRPDIAVPLADAVGYSFPSGHAAAAAALYLTLAVIVTRQLDGAARILFRVIFGMLIILVAASRVYLGIHYPTDAAGGIVLGILWAVVVLRFAGRGNLSTRVR
jgi:undecaprenyl-diphosphatase